jgi:hypothetical protein
MFEPLHQSQLLIIELLRQRKEILVHSPFELSSQETPEHACGAAFDVMLTRLMQLLHLQLLGLQRTTELLSSAVQHGLR